MSEIEIAKAVLCATPFLAIAFGWLLYQLGFHRGVMLAKGILELDSTPTATFPKSIEDK